MKDINLTKLVKYILYEFPFFIIFRGFSNMGRITLGLLSANADNWSSGCGNIRKRWTSVHDVRGGGCLSMNFYHSRIGRQRRMLMVLTGSPILHIFIVEEAGNSLRRESSRRYNGSLNPSISNNTLISERKEISETEKKSVFCNLCY